MTNTISDERLEQAITHAETVREWQGPELLSILTELRSRRASDKPSEEVRYIVIDHTGCEHITEDRDHASELARALAADFKASPPTERDGVTEEIAAERRRQREAEGWTPEHDDQHTKFEMAAAAGVYALSAASHDYRWVLRGSPVNDYLASAMKLWPWEKSWFKPTDRRRDLVKAGALVVAEIERLDRAALTASIEGKRE